MLLRIANIYINNSEIACVLFDNEEKGFIGSRCFYAKHKNILNNKEIINIDSIGDGDIFVVGYSNIMMKNNIEKRLDVPFNNQKDGKFEFIDMKKLTKASDFVPFIKGNSLTISAYYMIKNKLTITKIHTKKDSFDEGCISQEKYYNNISTIVNFISRYCDKLDYCIIIKTVKYENSC